MSKKNKKLKKQLRHNLVQMSHGPVGVSSSSVTPESAQLNAEIKKNPEPEKIEEVESAEEAGREIKKILITVLILVSIIIGVYFLSVKTGFILTAGEWLTKILNIKVGTN